MKHPAEVIRIDLPWLDNSGQWIVGSGQRVRRSAVRRYPPRLIARHERLRAMGCEVELQAWPRMFHVWHMFARILPEARAAIARIGAFLQARLS
jgi:acetyl esterase/lipase